MVFQSGISPPNSGEDQKKVFATFWFYLSQEFWITYLLRCCRRSEVRENSSPFFSCGDIV